MAGLLDDPSGYVGGLLGEAWKRFRGIDPQTGEADYWNRGGVAGLLGMPAWYEQSPQDIAMGFAGSTTPAVKGIAGALGQKVEGNPRSLGPTTDGAQLASDKAKISAARVQPNNEAVMRNAQELIDAVRERLINSGYEVYQPANPNSLSKYLMVGRKDSRGDFLNSLHSLKLRLSDHQGYGDAFLDFRPATKGLYKQDPGEIAERLLSELKKRADLYD